MTRPCVLLFIGLLAALATASPSPGPVEAHIKKLESTIDGYRTGHHQPFVHKDAKGQPIESYVVTDQSYTHTNYDANGVKSSEWTVRKSQPRSMVYESWYGPKRDQERLQVDDRTVEYTSWWENGKKWEEYTYNILKDQKSYNVYNKDGKLLP